MIKNSKEIQQLKVLIEVQFKQMEKLLKEYDTNVSKMLKKLNTQREYSTRNQYSEDVEIKVRSYMDSDILKT